MGDTDLKVRLIALEAQAEAAYEAMYESRFGTAGHYSDAKDFMSAAIALARELQLESEVLRFSKRLAHIKAVYRSQFS